MLPTFFRKLLETTIPDPNLTLRKRLAEFGVTVDSNGLINKLDGVYYTNVSKMLIFYVIDLERKQHVLFRLNTTNKEISVRWRQNSNLSLLNILIPEELEKLKIRVAFYYPFDDYFVNILPPNLFWEQNASGDKIVFYLTFLDKPKEILLKVDSKQK